MEGKELTEFYKMLFINLLPISFQDAIFPTIISFSNLFRMMCFIDATRILSINLVTCFANFLTLYSACLFAFISAVASLIFNLISNFFFYLIDERSIKKSPKFYRYHSSSVKVISSRTSKMCSVWNMNHDGISYRH